MEEIRMDEYGMMDWWGEPTHNLDVNIDEYDE